MLVERCEWEWLNISGRTGHRIDIFDGCTFGCRYPCWARILKKKTYPNWINATTRPAFLSPLLAEQLTKDIKRLRKPASIVLSSTSDFFCYLGKEQEDTIRRIILLSLARVLEEQPDLQIYVLTKSAKGLEQFATWLAALKPNLWVGVTITSLAKTWYEPFADRPPSRLFALRFLKSHFGLKTFVSIEPWIAGLTDPAVIIETARPIADLFIIGAHNYARKWNRDFYREKLPEIVRQAKEQKIKLFIKEELRELLGEIDYD